MRTSKCESKFWFLGLGVDFDLINAESIKNKTTLKSIKTNIL